MQIQPDFSVESLSDPDWQYFSESVKLPTPSLPRLNWGIGIFWELVLVNSLCHIWKEIAGGFCYKPLSLCVGVHALKIIEILGGFFFVNLDFVVKFQDFMCIRNF